MLEDELLQEQERALVVHVLPQLRGSGQSEAVLIQGGRQWRGSANSSLTQIARPGRQYMGSQPHPPPVLWDAPTAVLTQALTQPRGRTKPLARSLERLPTWGVPVQVRMALPLPVMP